MGETRSEPEGSSSVTWEHLEPFIRTKIQQLVQELLEQEVTEHLGRGRYERRDEGGGYRNGYGKPRRLGMQGHRIVQAGLDPRSP